MNAHELVGYFASLLVLATFCMRDMVVLRVVAITSNIAFIAYGTLADVVPVLMLHVVLLPVNLLRLVESVRSVLRRRAEAANRAPARRARSGALLEGSAEPAIASRRLRGFAPPARSLRRATSAATPRRPKQETI